VPVMLGRRAPRDPPAAQPMRTAVHTAVVVALTVGLVALVLRNVDLAEVWGAMRQVDGLVPLAAVGLVFLSYVLRARRWQYLLAPLGGAHFVPAFRTTVIGFAASFLLPARAGEFLRPWLLARHEGLRPTAVFATIIFERILDLVVVVAALAAYLLLLDPGLARLDPGVYAMVRLGGAGSAAAAAVALVVIFVLAAHPERIAGLVRSAERVLPARIAHAVADAARTFSEGLAVVRQPARLAGALAWSIPLWGTIAFEIWLVSRGFGIPLPPSGTLLVMAMLVVGVAVPTPGAVGGFHAAYTLAVTTFFGATKEPAVAAAIVLHAVGFAPTTLVGIWMMARDGMSLGRLRTIAATAQAEETHA
jgi:uncharacterized protein (TIRG00374 family)